MTRLAIRSTIAGAVLLFCYAAVMHPGEVAMTLIWIAAVGLAAKVTGCIP